MGKRRKGGRRTLKPDDYFASGPFEFARFEKMMIGRSRAMPEQFAAAQARMAEHFAIVVAEINALVSSMAGRIARLPLGRLLHRAWWEFAAIVTGVGGKKASDSDKLAAMRMIEGGFRGARMSTNRTRGSGYLLKATDRFPVIGPEFVSGPGFLSRGQK